MKGRNLFSCCVVGCCWVMQILKSFLFHFLKCIFCKEKNEIMVLHSTDFRVWERAESSHYPWWKSQWFWVLYDPPRLVSMDAFSTPFRWGNVPFALSLFIPLYFPFQSIFTLHLESSLVLNEQIKGMKGKRKMGWNGIFNKNFPLERLCVSSKKTFRFEEEEWKEREKLFKLFAPLFTLSLPFENRKLDESFF